MANIKQPVLLFILLIASVCVRAEDGYDLWLRYKIVNDTKLLSSYRNSISGINIAGNSPTLLAAKEELANGLKGLLGKIIPRKLHCRMELSLQHCIPIIDNPAADLRKPVGCCR